MEICVVEGEEKRRPALILTVSPQEKGPDTLSPNVPLSPSGRDGREAPVRARRGLGRDGRASASEGKWIELDTQNR